MLQFEKCFNSPEYAVDFGLCYTATSNVCVMDFTGFTDFTTSQVSSQLSTLLVMWLTREDKVI